MLTAEEEQRFFSEVPTNATITWDNTDHLFTATTWWADQDHDQSYPSIIVERRRRSVVKDQQQPVDDRLSSENVDDDETLYIEHYGVRVFDEYGIHILADGGPKNGVPEQVRCGDLARLVWRWAGGLDHNEETEGSSMRPVRYEVASPVLSSSLPGDIGADTRYEFTMEAHHTEHDPQNIPRTDSIEYVVDVNPS